MAVRVTPAMVTEITASPLGAGPPWEEFQFNVKLAVAVAFATWTVNGFVCSTIETLGDGKAMETCASPVRAASGTMEMLTGVVLTPG